MLLLQLHEVRLWDSRLLALVGAICSFVLGCSSPETTRSDSAVRDAGPDGEAGAKRSDGSFDATVLRDGGIEVDASGGACTNHHDCEQGSFCHRGTCREDEELVYHCGKPGCPPGHWCVEADGKRSRCTEDLAYACESACDCGPAHCCIDHDENPDTPKRCIKDADDPYLPGLPSSTGATCKVGPDYTFEERDPTYCAQDVVACLAASAYWQRSSRVGTFVAFDDLDGDGQGTPVDGCAAGACYGTSCDCDPGESCVDPSSSGDGYEPACTVLGTCMSHAIAESVFAWSTDELLDCCDDNCTPGARCELTSMIEGSFVRRLVGTCGREEDCVCGDELCCPSEFESCRSDCVPGHAKCGDGICDLFEDFKFCPNDCPGWCGDGRCEAALVEGEESCPIDCTPICGDGRCNHGETEESCLEDCAKKCERDRSLEVTCEDGPCRMRVAFPDSQYSLCGDGICQYHGYADGPNDDFHFPNIPTEFCLSCPEDCGPCTK